MSHEPASTIDVIAGLFPATPIILYGQAFISGVAGTSPAMTARRERTKSSGRAIFERLRR
jgi:hypothetical protein